MRRPSAIFGAITVLAAGAPVVAGASPKAAGWNQPATPSPDDVKSLAATIRNRSLTPESRLRAAESLVTRAGEPAARQEIALLLDPGGAGAALTIEALAKAMVAPPELLPALRTLAERSPAIEVAPVLRAASSVRTREAAALLLEFTDAAQPPEIRTAAFDALARLSGRGDLNTSPERWREWLEWVRPMSDARWEAELVSGLARRGDTLAAEVRSASGRVLDALRRLYLATPPAERSGLLTAMLSDESTDTRALGFELASRELSASRRLDDSVGEVAMELLAHPDPGVRASAAALVNRLNPPQGEARVLEALGRETEPGPASAMILAAARRPSADGVDAVFRWLDKRGPAFGAAVDATWALLRGGHLTRPDDAARVMRALNATPDDQLTPSCCAILSVIGGRDGFDRLASLLRTSSPSLRVAAAQALVLSPESLDDILAAARDEPQLFEVAAQGVMMHRPTAAAFRALSALAAPTPEAQRRALLSVAAQLPATDLLEVARESGNDMALRESYLTLLASPNRILSERADPAKLEAIAEGVVLLARTRIGLDRPDGAVAALDALPELSDLVDHLRVSRLRALAMLCLNRIEEAAALGAPASVWLDALERCVNKPFAPALAEEIRVRFGADLASDEAARFAHLAELLPPLPPTPEEKEFVGPPAPSGK